MECDFGEPARIFRGAISDQPGAQSTKIVAPLLQEDEIHLHAAGQRDRECLHGRRSGLAGAVDGQTVRTSGRVDAELRVPFELDDRGWTFLRVAQRPGLGIKRRELSSGAGFDGPRRTAASEQACECQPDHRQHDQEYEKPLAGLFVRSARFGHVVEELAVREDVRLGQLVESVNEQLNDEHHQEHGGDLEELREIDPVSVSRPEPRHDRGDERSGDGAGDDLSRADLEQGGRSSGAPFPSLARNHQHREREYAEKRCNAALRGGVVQAAFDLALDAGRRATCGR